MRRQSLLAGAFLVSAWAVAPAAAEIETVAPEEMGMSSDRLARLTPVIQKYVDEKKAAGFTTLVAREGKIVHFDTYGGKAMGSTNMTEDTIFRIYSMSKPITSVAIMMLYEEGKLLLTDPVAKYIPSVANMKVYVKEGKDGPVLEDQKRPMQVRDLLTHTSGIVYPFNNHPVAKLYGGAFEFDPRKDNAIYDMNLAQFMETLSTLPLAAQPGSEWHYGFSTDVLGRIIEVVSGQSLDVFFKERIFDPLGMVDTAFYVPESKLNRFTVNYTFSDKAEDGTKVQPIDSPVDGLYAKTQRAFLSGGGGLVGTTRDYLRFCQMLLNGGILDGNRLLSPKTIAYMTANHLPDNARSIPWTPGVGFGLGFSVMEEPAFTGSISSIGSYAWGGAAGTIFWIDPQEEIIVILMKQLMSSPYPIREQLSALVYQAIVE